MPPDAAARARRNSRGRLLRYLLRGGRLVEDESGHYCRASRSGEPYAKDIVARLIDKGAKIDGQEHHMVKTGPTWGLVACD